METIKSSIQTFASFIFTSISSIISVIRICVLFNTMISLIQVNDISSPVTSQLRFYDRRETVLQLPPSRKKIGRITCTIFKDLKDNHFRQNT